MTFLGVVNFGEPERLAYSIAEVAELLGLGTANVRKLVHSGQLEHVRVGRRIIIGRAKLLEFLAKTEQE